MAEPAEQGSVARDAEGFLVPPLVRFAALVVESLSQAREEIDALNVYPVPDGDTGTNLFLTFEAARQALDEAIEAAGDNLDLPSAVKAYARGLLLGARGNSGVIMSSLVGALFKRIGQAGPQERPAQVFAEGMEAATEAAYAAVGQPVEGTILSVARDASQAASQAAKDPKARSAQVILQAGAAARESLERTPQQLAVLRNAGVVDAGGRGLCLVLEAAYAAYTGRVEVVPDTRRRRKPIPVPMPTDDLSADGPSYEVMYLLEADDERIGALRRELGGLGDSLVVVGGDGLWNVHVHVDDVGAALEAGMEVGRPYRVRVTHFAEQITERKSAHRGRAVLVFSAGEGLDDLYREAGAAVVTASGTAHRPSTGDFVKALRACKASEAVILPNDRDVVPAAEAAARIVSEEDNCRATVIATTAQVQGIAALAVHDSARDFNTDLVEMAAAARHARSGAVTVAAREAITSAGPCQAGDALGAIEGDFVIVGSDLTTVAVEVLERMLGGGGEMVTVIAGADGAELAEECSQHLRRTRPGVDVVTYHGGQRRYPVLFGVE